MKRVRTKKKIQKVVLRKRITLNISGHIQREECSQNTVSQASLGPINGEDDSSSSASFQENFSNRSQHINNYHNTSSSDDQSTITEEELQMGKKEFKQIIVDSGIDFQALPG
ncbi:16695_t:CDS:2, partial [Gigaspora rosea]